MDTVYPRNEIEARQAIPEINRSLKLHIHIGIIDIEDAFK